MNPLVKLAGGAAVRWMVTIAATRGVILSEDLAWQIFYGAVAAGTLIWSLIQKQNADAQLKEARDLPPLKRHRKPYFQ